MVEKLKIIHKKTLYNQFRQTKMLWVILFIGLLLCVPMVSAFDFDNVKSFEKQDMRYGKATITNAFGFGSTLAEIELLDNTDTCGLSCYAEGKVVLHQDNKLIDSLIFKELSGKSKNINYKLYIKSGEEEVIVDDYAKECNDLFKGDVNYRCPVVKKGSHKENKNIWTLYNGRELSPGTYYWRLEGKKSRGETIDWLGNWFGVEVNDWALWGGEDEPVAYYKLDASSGTNVLDSALTGSYNGTASNIGWVAGKLNNGANFTGTDGSKITATSLNAYVNNIEEISLSAWINWSHGDGAIVGWWQATNLKLVVDFSANINKISFCVTSVCATSPLYYNDSAFHLVVGTWTSGLTAGSIKLFVDGENVINATLGGGPFEDTDAFAIGSDSSGTNNFNGTIDEVGIWNYSLSTQDVIDLYNAGAGVSYGGTSSTSNITLIFPPDGNSSSSPNVTFNCSGEDSVGIDNLTLILDNNEEVNYTQDGLGALGLGLETTVYGFSEGWHNWTCNLTSSSSAISTTTGRGFIINSVSEITVNQATDKTSIGEGETAAFNLSLDYNNIPTSTAVLIWNNTEYIPSTIESSINNYYFSLPLIIPTDSGNATGNLITWYWIFNISGVTNNYNTDGQTQTVLTPGIDDCSGFSAEIINISLRDEETDTSFDGTEYNATIEVDTTLTNGDTWSFNTSFYNQSDVRLCVPNNFLSSSSTHYNLDIKIKYKADTYVEEYFYIDSYNLTNSTVPKYIYLRDLKDVDSTTFIVSYEDDTGLSLEGAVITLLREYLGEGEFKEVEAGKTNNIGETLLHFVEEDAVYIFNISLNGELDYTSEEYRVYCVAGQECRIDLRKGRTTTVIPGIEEWDNLPEGYYNITGNESTRVITLLFNMNESHQMNISVYEYSSNETKQSDLIGTNSTTSSSGYISLYVPDTYGNTTFYVQAYKDNNWFAYTFINLKVNIAEYFGGIGLFMTALIVITLIMMSLSTGVGVLIFAILGMAISIILQLIDMPYSVLMYLICASFILIIKIMERRGR